MSTVRPLRPTTDTAELVEQLDQHATDNDLALIPTGLDDGRALTARLGPQVTGTDLGEFLTLAQACGVRVLYLANGHHHLGAAATGETGPAELAVQFVHAGVLHTWQHPSL